jgi:orotidine-5'-phosphate decarboxylase
MSIRENEPSSRPAIERLVLPLDVPDLDEARVWIDRLRGEVGVFKVGLELFAAAGPDAVRMVHDAGADCFLDLKLHDIPATMARATEIAAALGVRYLTVHASAGSAALRECVATCGRTTVLAVTVLTSLDEADLRAIGCPDGPGPQALRLAKLAVSVGVPGLVCSSAEVGALRRELGPEVTLVTPGIRPAGEGKQDDQKRVGTPASAIRDGSSLLVVGRPIRDAQDPALAAKRILDEIAEAERAQASR